MPKQVRMTVIIPPVPTSHQASLHDESTVLVFGKINSKVYLKLK